MVEKNLIVIDDFYDQPELVVKHALGLSYKSHEGSTYPGKNSTIPLWHEPIRTRLSKLIGNEVVPAPGTANGLFRLSHYDSRFKQDIHVDPGSDWAGVLYLTRNHPPVDGTTLWKHKEKGMETCPRTHEEAQQYGFENFQQIRKEIMYGDGLNRSLWDPIYRVPFKYNRLVLFRPWMFHSHGENFGTSNCDLDHLRLVQLFFLHEKEGFHGKDNQSFSNIINKNTQQTPIKSGENTKSNRSFSPSEVQEQIEVFKKHHIDNANSKNYFDIPEQLSYNQIVQSYGRYFDEN